MSCYTVALFAHIVGVLTLFITLSLEWLITLRLRRAGAIAQAREWSGLAKGVNRIAPVTAVLILGAVMYMTAIAWSLLTTWVAVSLAAMVIMMIFGMGVVGRRLRAIQRAAAAASTETIDAALQSRIDDPSLWISLQMAVAVALSIVFMITNKPDLSGSIIAVIVSLALGALVGILTLRPRRQTQATALRVNEASVG
jgi:uncharacterized membrane protein